MFDNNYNNPYNTETRSLSTKVSAVMKRVYFKDDARSARVGLHSTMVL